MYKGQKERYLAALAGAAFLTAAAVAAAGQIPAETAAVTTQNPPVTAAATPPATPQETVKAPAPKFVPTPEQIGDSLMAHQRYQAAIEQYKKAPRDSADAWNKIGVAYQLMLNLDEATHCYEQAFKLNPKNAIVLNNLGTVYVTQKQYSRAEKYYRKALKLDPKSALVHKNMGTALLAEHKYKDGWKQYQEALASDPEIFQHNNTVRVENPASIQERGAMNYYMAKGCVRAGQAERAIEYLRMAINEGFTTPKKIAADVEFTALFNNPAFQQMLASQRAQ